MQAIDERTPCIVTISDWFAAGDGRRYQHVAGVVRVVSSQELFGFELSQQEGLYLKVGETAVFPLSKVVAIVATNGGINSWEVCVAR